MSKEKDVSELSKHKYKKKGVSVVLKKIYRIFLIIFLILFIIGGCIAGYIYHKIKPDMVYAKQQAQVIMSEISDKTFANLENTVIYDKDDNIIQSINVSTYDYKPHSEISKYILDGYVAVEDRNFYKHNGIDYWALGRAFYELVKNKGEITQGGSTITQQIIKVSVLSDVTDKWQRKMIEFYLAPMLEEKYTKSEILEMYCNKIYYQNNCYGVGAASKYYFGKDTNELEPQEAALLIGISNNPARYNPVTHPEASIEKRNRVLLQMRDMAVISEYQYRKAVASSLNLTLQREEREKENYMASYALHCATLQLMKNDLFEFRYYFSDKTEYEMYQERYEKKYSENARKLRQGGYKIYTSLDPTIQNELQYIVDDVMVNFTETSDDGRFSMQASATVVDNDSQMVVAVVGGRGTDDEYNRAYQSHRQPGSSIKPFFYTMAFDTGLYYPSYKLKNEKLTEKGAPKNYDNKYTGTVSIREGIEKSVNVACYNLVKELQPNKAVLSLAKMQMAGLSWEDAHNNSVAVGGFTYGMSTSEMAKAYSVFVNGGEYKTNTCLRKITFGENGKDDKIIPITNSSNQVFEPDSTYMVLDCMKGVLNKSYATGYGYRLNKNITSAGKTGTTNDNKDGWMCGVTNKYSAAVWAGYDTPRAVRDMGSGRYPGSIWNRIQTYLNSQVDDEIKSADFTKPETVGNYYIRYDGTMSNYKTGKSDLFSDRIIETLKIGEITEATSEVPGDYISKKSNDVPSTSTTEEQQTSEQDKAKSAVNNFYSMPYLSSNDFESFKSEYNRILGELDYYGLSETKDDVIAYYNRILGSRDLEIERNNAQQSQVSSARDALGRLHYMDKSSPNYQQALSEAKSSIDACSGTSEYNSLLSEYNNILNSSTIQNKPDIEHTMETVTNSDTEQKTNQEPSDTTAEQPPTQIPQPSELDTQPVQPAPDIFQPDSTADEITTDDDQVDEQTNINVIE